MTKLISIKISDLTQTLPQTFEHPNITHETLPQDHVT